MPSRAMLELTSRRANWLCARPLLLGSLYCHIMLNGPYKCLVKWLPGPDMPSNKQALLLNCFTCAILLVLQIVNVRGCAGIPLCKLPKQLAECSVHNTLLMNISPFKSNHIHQHFLTPASYEQVPSHALILVGPQSKSPGRINSPKFANENHPTCKWQSWKPSIEFYSTMLLNKNLLHEWISTASLPGHSHTLLPTSQHRWLYSTRPLRRQWLGFWLSPMMYDVCCWGVGVGGVEGEYSVAAFPGH